MADGCGLVIWWCGVVQGLESRIRADSRERESRAIEPPVVAKCGWDTQQTHRVGWANTERWTVDIEMAYGGIRFSKNTLFVQLQQHGMYCIVYVLYRYILKYK